MDMISELPEDLLLHILSLLPLKDIVSTSLLSKRWKNLWKLVPKLSYDDRNYNYLGANYTTFIHFVEKSLLLYEAPVLGTFKLRLGPSCSPDDIGLWIRLAVDRNVRNIAIKFYFHHGQIRLPRSLCISRTLVVLKLKNAILEDISSSACFKSLKTLHLKYVVYSSDESPRRLLSCCPCLRDLVLKRDYRDNVKRFEVKVRYLQSLTVSMLSLDDEEEAEAESDEYVIDTPFLKNLRIKDHCTDLCSFQEMTQLEEANLQADFTCSKTFFGSLRYSKKLSLCLRKPKFLHFKDVIFSWINTLEICTCDDENWLRLLMCLLNASPKLRVLKLEMIRDCEKTDSSFDWNQPSSVPECLSKSLESFEYRDYEGTANERKLLKYILKNGTCLKKVMMFPVSECLEEISQSIKEDLEFLSSCLSSREAQRRFKIKSLTKISSVFMKFFSAL